MNDTIGTLQVTRPTTGNLPNNTTYVYMGRWVSPQLTGITTIDANTWTVNFAVSQASTNSNFPVNGNSQPIYINAYVWRPGGAVLGTILDGNSNSDFNEPSATTERVMHGTFAGSQVTGVQNGDVICIELWTDMTATPNQNWSDRIYFDGTVENITPNTVVTDHASFISTPQDLAGVVQGAFRQYRSYNKNGFIPQTASITF